MTNFATQVAFTPVLTSVCSKEKGSAKNRTKCAGSHIKNSVITNLETTALTGAAVGTGYYLTKTPTAMNAVGNNINKGVSWVTNKLGLKTYEWVKGPASRAANGRFKPGVKTLVTKDLPFVKKILNASAKTKAFAAIAALALPVLAYITHKHAYKAGQIDQKYTDKAVMQKAI